MRARVLIAALLLAVLAAASPARALGAEEVPHVYVLRADYAAGTVTLAAHHETDTAQVLVVSAGKTVSTTTCGPRVKTPLAPYRLRARTTLSVVGLDAAGDAIWTRAVTLDPVDYRPRKPHLFVAEGRVVGSSRWKFSGTAYRPVTKVRALEREMWRSTVVTMAPSAGGDFTFGRVAVPFGMATFDVVASNGFGSSPRAVVHVYYLGTSLPDAERYELVSKRILWLFDISRGRVLHAWPVAIGTPQTPTPTGYFRLGSAQPSGGDWGVLRRPLYRVVDGRVYTTGYYIHGTDAPWSIGTPASHGCVRMYNSDVREFARVVPSRTLVFIR